MPLFDILRKIDLKKNLRQYFKSGTIGIMIFETIFIGIDKKSLEIIRLISEKKIYSRIRKKYYKYAKKNSKIINSSDLKQKHSNVIWFCWFQGIEQAPEVVRACYKSLKKNISQKKIIVIDKNNIDDYVKIPSFILDKYNNGIISNTHFSDILRLELLIKYGGTWIDSTVFCSSKKINFDILNSDLFVYQIMKPGLDGHSLRISSWLMTSCSNNEVLLLCRRLLYKYWEKNNKMIDYFLLHDFFELSIEMYPDKWEKVTKISNETPHVLLFYLFKRFNEKEYEKICEQTSFHKLTYKFPKEDLELKNTFYKELMKKADIN